jgi:hypothetical protein
VSRCGYSTGLVREPRKGNERAPLEIGARGLVKEQKTKTQRVFSELQTVLN